MGRPKGFKLSQESKDKISNSILGDKNPMFGKRHSDDTKKKMRESHKDVKGLNNPMYGIHRFREKAPNWNGDIRKDSYPIYFTKELKLEIYKRDNYTCQLCNSKSHITCHHIDYNKQNCNKENLITLCHRCNIRVNKDRIKWFNYFLNLMIKNASLIYRRRLLSNIIRRNE